MDHDAQIALAINMLIHIGSDELSEFVGRHMGMFTLAENDALGRLVQAITDLETAHRCGDPSCKVKRAERYDA